MLVIIEEEEAHEAYIEAKHRRVFEKPLTTTRK
jgi:hypothetical protein